MGRDAANGTQRRVWRSHDTHAMNDWQNYAYYFRGYRSSSVAAVGVLGAWRLRAQDVQGL
jgi:hypothetical protein